MKCPNCGKKMKKSICAKCGYDPAAKAQEEKAAVATSPAFVPQINYYTYDPANPSVIYPVTVSTQAQTSTSSVMTALPMPVQAPTSVAATATPSQQSAGSEDFSTKVSKKVGKKAEKIAKKLAEKAEKKMTKQQKKAAKAVLDTVEKLEKVPNNVASRLFAVALIALCVFMFVIVKFYAVTDLTQVGSSMAPQLAQGNMLAIFVNALQSEDTLFGVIPAFFSNGGEGMAYNLSVYIFPICVVVAVLYAIMAIFSKEKAPRRVRRSLFFLGAGALDYTVSTSLFLGSGEESLVTGALADKVSMFTLGGYHVDLIPFAIGGACLILSFLFLIFRRRVKEQIETNTQANADAKAV